MKWFKHNTDWHTDGDICDAVVKFGHFGYSFYVIMKEIYGLRFNETDGKGVLKTTITDICRKMHTRRRNLLAILDFFQTRGRMEYRMENEFLYVRIPEFIRVANNWEQRRDEDFKARISTMCCSEEEEKNKEEKRKEEKSEAHLLATDDVFLSEAKEILETLNEKTGKDFKDTSLIYNQLRAGKKKSDFLRIIKQVHPINEYLDSWRL